MRNGKEKEKRHLTGWFQCQTSCGWRKATTMFWLRAIDFVLAHQCPKCGATIAFCQTPGQYMANTGRLWDSEKDQEVRRRLGGLRLSRFEEASSE